MLISRLLTLGFPQSAIMETTQVFVYGTLKRGEPNHGWMMKTGPGQGCAELLGSARTCRPFPLLVAGPYNIPYCLDRPGEGHRIFGEVYRVDADKMKRLDELEAYPKHYNRRQEDVIISDDPEDTPVKAWIYLWENYTDEHLRLKLIDNYTNDVSSESGRYVPKELREKPAWS
ncbi:putative gamma-glutamylcyclotransferase [Amphibalanus amphitrite]|uniref:Gamma-glutamylcyclotransferase family protein n=1 Tax=Amphibalanus amphitrite TaxID=1232801 RepID=A0A6A4W3P0_AMPAM|nr:putative gamma-glutamylcyclotransferase [Amphibalanus amphitrite]